MDGDRKINDLPLSAGCYSPTEADILTALTGANGKFVPWNKLSVGMSLASLRVHIHRLRKKLARRGYELVVLRAVSEDGSVSEYAIRKMVRPRV
jgi:hypothetical protein